MRECRAFLASLTCFLFSFYPVHGSEKKNYTLRNPTPDALLRNLTTDRPDLTESPFTVDAGRYQVELNAFGFTRSEVDADGGNIDSFEFGTVNMRIGITHNSELNVVFQPYGTARARSNSQLEGEHDEGVGGVEIRGKINVYGNDTFAAPGDTALALLPFVSIPTDRSNGISPEDVEGGLIIPFAVQLPSDFGLGINGGILAIKDDEGPDYHAEYLASVSLSYEWDDQFGTYYEIATILGTKDPRGDILLLGMGFTYGIRDNLQLDGGVNFGVTSASDRFNPFVGLTQRF